ncbi:dTMP kinase [soil metagenome]
MFITFEGIDLSGKSTQARLLLDHLTGNNKKAILVREPGGTPISEKIRDILLDKTNEKMTYPAEFLLFSASRNQLTEEVIKPHLAKDYVVICDRYFDSSTAYQGYGGDIDIAHIEAVNKIASGGLDPEITFFINISAEESFKRKSVRNQDEDRIEQKKIEYYNKVVNGYFEIASKNKRFKIIDGTKKIEDIQAEILTILKM